MPTQWTQFFIDQMEAVDILLKDPRTGDLNTVVSGVEMLIVPTDGSDNTENLDVSPDRHLFGGVFRETRNDLRKRNNIIRRADGTELTVLRVLQFGRDANRPDFPDYQRLILEDRSVQ